MTAPGATVLPRLRAAGLRPTVARIGVLQVIEASGERLCAEDVFRGMTLRGTRACVSTIYRAIHELEAAGLLLREWSAQRKAFYRLKHAHFDAAPLYLVCPDSGRVLALDDADLHARLLEAARHAGVALDGRTLSVQVAEMPGAPMRTRLTRTSTSPATGLRAAYSA